MYYWFSTSYSDYRTESYLSIQLFDPSNVFHFLISQAAILWRPAHYLVGLMRHHVYLSSGACIAREDFFYVNPSPPLPHLQVVSKPYYKMYSYKWFFFFSHLWYYLSWKLKILLHKILDNGYRYLPHTVYRDGDLFKNLGYALVFLHHVRCLILPILFADDSVSTCSTIV